MRLRAARCCTLTLVLSMALATTSLAQGIPGTRAGVAGQRGWDAISDGRNEDAATAFAEALAAESRDPSLYLGAGVAAYRLGRTGDARRALQQALTLAPNLTAASMVLGEIFYRES